MNPITYEDLTIEHAGTRTDEDGSIVHDFCASRDIGDPRGPLVARFAVLSDDVETVDPPVFAAHKTTAIRAIVERTFRVYVELDAA